MLSPASSNAHRIGSLREAMKEQGVDALVIAGRGVIGQYGNLWYVVGYCPVIRPAWAVLLPEGPVVLVVPTVSDMHLAREAGVIADMIPAQPSANDPSGFAGPIAEALSVLAPGSKIGIVGTEDSISARDYAALASHLNLHMLVSAGSLMARQKAVKSAFDIEAMGRAAAIADQGMIQLGKALAATRNPAAAAGAAEAVVRAAGAHEVLVYVSDGAQYLHRPRDETLSDNSLVTAFVEISTREGYWVELARLHAIGRLDSKKQEVAECAQAVLSLCESTLRAGRPAEVAHAEIEAFINASGMTSGLWYGHGVGVDHDLPTIGAGCKESLAVGSTIAIHPHIMTPDGAHGASLCETMLVGSDGAMPLSRLSRKLVSL